MKSEVNTIIAPQPHPGDFIPPIPTWHYEEPESLSRLRDNLSLSEPQDYNRLAMAMHRNHGTCAPLIEEDDVEQLRAALCSDGRSVERIFDS